MIKLIVCDLDGTLCNHTPRMHLAAAGDWDAYHSGLQQDEINPAVQWFLSNTDLPLLFLTGRPEPYRGETIAWLARHEFYENDEFEALLMRGKMQGGSDTVVKAELLKGWLEEFGDAKGFEGIKPEEILILEDRDKMVAAWRDLGYNCWQVAEGSF